MRKLHWLAGCLLFLFVSMCASTVFAQSSLKLPFPCNETYRVSQGHNTGSHTGKGGWAWDFAIPSGGVVSAPGDGKVSLARGNSSRHCCSSDCANDANYVVINLDDGPSALLLHLKAGSIRVNQGQRVSAGDPVGEVGLSGWVCGAHLHFQIQQSCGNWWCQSVQASFQHHGDPTSGSVTSQNCGGGSMDSHCSVPANGSKTITEQDKCVRRVTQYWWDDQPGGAGNHWYYTYATAKGSPDTVGWYDFKTEATGQYRVSVHIPSGAESTKAKYIVHDGNQEHSPVRIDQTASSGWKTLGTWQFQQDKEAYLKVPDNTGEAYSQQNRRRIGFDDIKIERVTASQKTYYADNDGDGYGDPNATKEASSQPSGYVSNSDDCNDSCASCKPGGEETCDMKDNNCNGQVDENGKTVFYRDADGDGYGTPSETKMTCGQPSGYAAKGGDCDDMNAAINPGAREKTDRQDNDCDGLIDERGKQMMSDAGTSGDTGYVGGSDAGGTIGQPPSGRADAGRRAGAKGADAAGITKTTTSCRMAGGDDAPVPFWMMLLAVGIGARRLRRAHRSDQ